MKGGGSGSAVVRRALRSLRFGFDRLATGRVGPRETCRWRGRGRASDATHSRVAHSGLRRLCPGRCRRRGGGGPELGRSAASRDLRGGDAAGGVEGVEGVVDLAGGLVVVQRLA